VVLLNSTIHMMSVVGYFALTDDEIRKIASVVEPSGGPYGKKDESHGRLRWVEW
jgi:hypothetical protein